MCGGVGSRLRPLTETTPKPLIRLMNVPVLKHIIDKLIKAGINEIWLSLGFKAQEIILFCEQRKFDADIRYCEEEKPLGTAGGVKNCIGQSDEDVLVMSGDNIFNIDIDQIEAFHRLSDADITVVGKEVDDPREYGVIMHDDAGRITGFLEKPTWEKAESFLINTGIYILKGSVLDMIPENTQFDFAEQLFPMALEKKMNFVCCRTEGFWGDMGEVDAYLNLSGEMLKTFTDEFVYSGTLYTSDSEDERGNRYIAPCLIGSAFSPGKENTIGPDTVIGNGCALGDRCTLRGSVFGDHVTVSSDTDVQNAVIDECVSIGDNCLIEKNAVIGYGAVIGRFSRILTGCRVWPGRSISPESVVSRDMFYETPENIEPDVYGISGKVFSQLSISDAVKLGQSIASLQKTERIGIGTDGNAESEVYKNACVCGMRACDVICYDFEGIFLSQSYFFGSYCELDAFIYVSIADDQIRFSFFGRCGLPFTERDIRKINNNFRYSSYRFASSKIKKDIFHMHLMSFAYATALQNMVPTDLHNIKANIECENILIKNLLTELLNKCGASVAREGILFLINESGTELYCIENEKCFTGDRMRGVLCELSFAEGENVIVPDDMPDFITERAHAFNCSAIKINSVNAETSEIKNLLFDSLWNFDAVFLCIKVLSVIAQANITVDELLSLQKNFYLRRRVIELDCPPASVRSRILRSGAAKKKIGDDYYRIEGDRGVAKVRQIGNTNRIKVVVEAADSEIAKELGAELISKIKRPNIDKIAF